MKVTSLPETPTERETAEEMGTWIPTDASTYKAVHDDEKQQEAMKLGKQAFQQKGTRNEVEKR